LPVDQQAVQDALSSALTVLDHPAVRTLPDEQKHKIIWSVADRVSLEILRQYQSNVRYHPYRQASPPPPAGRGGGRGGNVRDMR
jgi:hypothetical protein